MNYEPKAIVCPTCKNQIQLLFNPQLYKLRRLLARIFDVSMLLFATSLLTWGFAKQPVDFETVILFFIIYYLLCALFRELPLGKVLFGLEVLHAEKTPTILQYLLREALFWLLLPFSLWQFTFSSSPAWYERIAGLNIAVKQLN